MERRELGEIGGNDEPLETMDSEELRVWGAGVGGWLSLVMGIVEGMYCIEQRVWCIHKDSGTLKRNLKNK